MEAVASFSGEWNPQGCRISSVEGKLRELQQILDNTVKEGLSPTCSLTTKS